MFGFSKKKKSNSVEQTLAKAEAVNLLKEFQDSLLEEKETRDLLLLEKERHEVLKIMADLQNRRDQNMSNIRKVWEEARKGGYSPTQWWESKMLFEEDRLNLASEYDAYYGYDSSVDSSDSSEE